MAYIKNELTPFYRTCENAHQQVGKGIYFLAVAAVAQTENNFPKKGFLSYNLDNFTKVPLRQRPHLDGVIVEQGNFFAIGRHCTEHSFPSP